MFDGIDVPRRVPPDSSLAPEWYRLENQRGKRVAGELMFAIWIGTHADEAFPKNWHLDASTVNDDGVAGIRSKIAEKNRQQPEILVSASHGNMVLRTKISQSKSVNPLWNEDLMFTASEPFEDQLFFEEDDGQRG